jgi:peptidoglycan/LPS O-acetylase OafA/YrhL
MRPQNDYPRAATVCFLASSDMASFTDQRTAALSHDDRRHPGGERSSNSGFSLMNSVTSRLRAEMRPTATSAPVEKRFWNNIQVLRLFAAYSIVYIHLEAVFYALGESRLVLDVLRLGTDLFVVVAGFLTAQVLVLSKKSGLEYLKHRATRILPLYFLFTILAYVVETRLMQHNEDSFSDLLMSLTFIPYGSYPVLYPTWTLQIIVGFSLIVGLVHLIAPRHSVYIASALVVAATVAGAVTKPSNSVLAFYTNPIVVDFAFGVAIFKLVTSNAIGRLPSNMAPFAMAGIILCLSLAVMRPFYWPEVPRLVALGIPASGLLIGVLLLETSGVAISSSTINFLAKCTYAIYLCHWFVNIVAEKTVAESGDSEVVSLLMLLAAPLAVTVVAIFIYLYVEAPTTRFLARRLQRPKAAPAAA